MSGHLIDLNQLFSQRLNELMEQTPELDTLMKVSKKSGVSYGTVRNVRKNLGVKTTADNLRLIAGAFGLTLAEFVADACDALELSNNEREIIKGLRELPADDFSTFLRQITKMAAMHKAERIAEARKAELLRDNPDLLFHESQHSQKSQ